MREIHFGNQRLKTRTQSVSRLRCQCQHDRRGHEDFARFRRAGRQAQFRVCGRDQRTENFAGAAEIQKRQTAFSAAGAFRALR